MVWCRDYRKCRLIGLQSPSYFSCPFPEGCLIMHIHDVYCINMPLRLLRFVILVFASRGLFGVEFTLFGVMLVVDATVMISCAGYRWLLWILCRRYSFRMMLVIVVTIMIGRAGFRWLEGISCCMYSFWCAACYCHDRYNWLCWFSLTERNFLMSVLFLAYCLLLLWLLQWVVLVPGSYVVFYTCFGCKVFSLGSCLWAFIVTF